MEVWTLGHLSGMKLMKVKTGAVVAVYANVNFSVTKMEKMHFFLDLGNDLRLMGTMALLSILEERRVDVSRSSRGGGMTGAMLYPYPPKERSSMSTSWPFHSVNYHLGF